MLKECLRAGYPRTRDRQHAQQPSQDCGLTNIESLSFVFRGHLALELFPAFIQPVS